MALVRVFTPQSASEQAVVVAPATNMHARFIWWQPDRPLPGMGATDEALLTKFGRR